MFKVWRAPTDRDHAAHVGPTTEPSYRAAFAAEVEAYQLARANPSTCAHVPTLFGTHRVHDILASDGTSILDRYLPDCCLELEWLSGNPHRVDQLRAPWAERATALRLGLSEAGVRYTCDMTYFVPDDPSGILRVVDFGTRDAQAESSLP